MFGVLVMIIGSFPKLLAAVSVAGIIAMSAASAATLNVTYQDSTVFGTPNLSKAVNITSPGYTGAVRVGQFRLSGDSGFGNFLAFCVDLAKFMSTGNSYTTSSGSAFGATVDGYIDRLFTSAYASVDTAVKGAAFQLALWEIISDTGSGYNLAGGSFKATAGSAVINQANSYLTGLAGASTGGYSITYLNSNTSQNLVTVSPVPLPAALGMLGVGIASLFGLRRRKKA